MIRRNEIVWGSILFVYGLTVLVILVLRRGSLGTGAVGLTAAAALCVLAFGLLTILRPGKSSFAADRGFVVFLFPLVLLVLTAATPGAPAVGSGSAAVPPSGLSDVNAPEIDDFDARLLSQEGPIEFDEKSYFHLHDALTGNPELGDGRQVQIDGFLSLSNPEGPTIGRYLLWCCASDAVFLGMALDGEVPAVPEGTWLEVSGRLSTTVAREGSGMVQRPVILVEETRILEEPDFVYVLPF
ncbi:MAG: hypothetical protein ACLFPV_14815 [Spirochaetaceae bacterium]